VGERLGAAAYFQLAHLLAGQGRTADGRAASGRALALDASYGSADANPGLLLYRKGKYEEAEAAFRRTLALNESDSYAHLGLGALAVRRKQWVEGEREFRSALEAQRESIDAHRHLAHTLEKLGQVDGAIQHYEQSLRLAMAGRKPLGGTIATDPDSARLLDADHGRIHACWLGSTPGGRDPEHWPAIAIAIGTGYDLPSIRFRLAWLYLNGAAGTNPGSIY
jgi:tetratricopeptide (TPR) repeat protein